MVLADSVILPFNVTHYGVNMKIFNTQIKLKFKEDFENYSASEELSKLLFSFSIYILIDVLLCSIAEYFYELCCILTSP